MGTRIYSLRTQEERDERLRDALRDASRTLRDGGLVVFPTETVYGIGCSASDPDAVRRLYAAKRRPSEKPLLLHLHDLAQAERLAFLDGRTKLLLSLFTPGPLSVVLPKREAVPDVVTAGGPTVGLRFPSHPLFLALSREAGVPIAATSANFSGGTSAKDGLSAAEALDGVCDVLLDGGVCDFSLESTVVSLVGTPKLLRQGAIPWEAVRDALEKRGMPRLIGLTGRSGAGKSTAGRFAREMGLTVLDCDEVYRELTSSPSDCLAAVGEAFGERAVAGGRLDRAFVRERVFSDADEMRTLNRLTARYMTRELFRRLRDCGEKAVLLDAPTLFETGLDEVCDRILAVDAPEEVCVERICARDGISPDEARKRLSKQFGREFFRERCEPLDGGGTFDRLREQVRNALQREL